MTDNPYAPPSSRVEDTATPNTPEPRPRQIVLAIRLAAINYGLGLVVVLATWDYFSQLQSIGAMIFNQLFSLALLVWLYYKVYAGRNWARIVLLVFFMLGGFMTLSSLFRELVMAAPAIAKAQMIVGLGMNLAIMWLLFLSPGRRWFGSTK